MSFRGLLAPVRAATSGERARETVQALARFHRIQASPGYDQAAQWMAAAVERLGVSPEIETVPGDGVTRCLGMVMPQGWDCARATAELVARGERRVLCDYDACRVSLVQRSAPARGSFPIVALADGTEDAHYDGVEVAGKVVLTAGAAHRVHTLAVVERGAAGLLCDGRRLYPPVRDRFEDPDQVAYTSFWWSGDEPRGWGFVLSPREGDALRRRLAAGESLALDVEIESRRFATPIPLLSARLAGPEPGEVLVVAHLCHPQPSANDNASGAAAALETLDVLARLAREGAWRPRRSVRCLWVPELTGSHAWFARDPERARRTVAALNLDMVGQDQERCGSTFLLESPPCFAASFAEDLLGRIRRESLDWIASYSGPGHYSLARLGDVPYSGGSDHALLNDPALGVPCPMLIQWPDRFYHSSHDTPDKTDPRSLALTVRCAATYAAHLAALDAAGVAGLARDLERHGHVRVLEARDAVDAPRAVRRAAMAADRALGSLARLGAGAGEIAASRARLAARVAPELEGVGELPARAALSGGERVPRRQVAAPLDSLRHLAAGVDSRAERERQRRLDQDAPGGATTFELAWYACDGARDLAAITELVWLESGIYAPQSIVEFFEWATHRGLAEWIRAGGA